MERWLVCELGSGGLSACRSRGGCGLVWHCVFNLILAPKLRGGQRLTALPQNLAGSSVSWELWLVSESWCWMSDVFGEGSYLFVLYCSAWNFIWINSVSIYSMAKSKYGLTKSYPPVTLWDFQFTGRLSFFLHKYSTASTVQLIFVNACCISPVIKLYVCLFDVIVVNRCFSPSAAMLVTSNW